MADEVESVHDRDADAPGPQEPPRRRAVDMDREEFIGTLRGLSFPAWAYYITCVPGALQQLGFGGLILQAVGLPLLIGYADATKTNANAPDLDGLKRIYDRCFLIPEFLRRRRRSPRTRIKEFVKGHWVSVISSTVGTTALIIPLVVFWDWICPGIDFPKYYELVQQARIEAAEHPNEPQAQKQGAQGVVFSYIDRNIYWNAEVKNKPAANEGGVSYIYIVPIVKTSSPGLAQAEKKEPNNDKPLLFSVKLLKKMSPDFFATVPMQVWVKGKITKIEWDNGVRIEATKVTKAE